MISLKAIAGATLLTLAGLQAAAQAQTLEVPSAELPIVETGQTLEVPSAELPMTTTEPTAADLSTDGVELAQRRRGRRGGGASPNFIGAGVNLGLGDDDSVVGDTNFAVISKISFTNNISLRPSVLFGDDVGFLVPVTYNFNNADVGVSSFNVVPYLGGGVAIGTDDDTDLEALITAGADVPISRQFTINGQANLGIGDDTGFGIMLGVGYNFSGLGL
ncbi:MAG: hypothetical protein AAGF01_32260 [Cyanobacteria bacterium P01_G01_bin.38]